MREREGGERERERERNSTQVLIIELSTRLRVCTTYMYRSQSTAYCVQLLSSKSAENVRNNTWKCQATSYERTSPSID